MLLSKMSCAGVNDQRFTLSRDTNDCLPNSKWLAVMFFQLQLMFK